ncbi:hypothetical protein Nepgr_019312 [Nepenthes gracilis]|uniref:Uncharacterized protein n=1 Tax=Nepenthes gracilis TaxID=150966 RepID=A0AAD3SV07_NEPGR|nr:hypothetical protein Nepgr_019312 [Nepenthes gracilis]
MGITLYLHPFRAVQYNEPKGLSCFFHTRARLLSQLFDITKVVTKNHITMVSDAWTIKFSSLSKLDGQPTLLGSRAKQKDGNKFVVAPFPKGLSCFFCARARLLSQLFDITEFVTRNHITKVSDAWNIKFSSLSKLDGQSNLLGSRAKQKVANKFVGAPFPSSLI